MAWQLRDPVFRAAIDELIDRTDGRFLLAGTVGVQVHIAGAIGLDKKGPPAHAIEVVPPQNAALPERIGDVPVRVVRTLGFDASIEAGRHEVEIGGRRYPVASPEHVLGMLAASVAGPRQMVSLNLHVNFLGSATEGEVVVVDGRIVRNGATVLNAEGTLEGGGRLLATATTNLVARRPRRVRTFRKYSRVPELEMTTQVADELMTFGGTTVGQVLRAGGVKMPFRARVHIYQAAPGSTLPSMLRTDRPLGGRGHAAVRHAHPLTKAAAGLLFREPRLGVSVPARYLRSRQRIAVGQRFYVLEPIGVAAPIAMPLAALQREEAQAAPSRAWMRINVGRARAGLGIYLSESDAQSAAEAIRQGRGGLGLIQTLARLLKALPPGGAPSGLPRRLHAWVMPALAHWVRANGEAFVRAAAHPDPGVTIRVRLTSLPGLDPGNFARSAPGRANGKVTQRGAPAVSISVTPGRSRK